MSVNALSVSLNMQVVARLFSKMSREEVVSSMQNAKFVESLSLADDELKAVNRYLKDSNKGSRKVVSDDIWS